METSPLTTHIAIDHPLIPGLHLTEARWSDRATLVRLINDAPEISQNTVAIPYPYSDQDAEFALREVFWKQDQATGQVRNFVIRGQDDVLMGVISLFHRSENDPRDSAELGYWLGSPYWGKSVMTTVVRCVLQVAFGDYGLRSVSSGCFLGNNKSRRVLEKSGFQLLDGQRTYTKLNGQVVQSHRFELKNPAMAQQAME
ncbi:acyl-CoA N-acyltransferase [Polychytrium aggregatum]|uniref:acyl-CoA N-acyltransferase n=1 Tax=Polychytrium aggregatum TaxID=110093 RepID=UPI0022FE8AA8|nr:acyl-CoA N-acyltransferase [Polychytrium aggregatum]KAI9208190.1 acyl-CoA N-acyltransferase [Polychytrium aggregatum]